MTEFKRGLEEDFIEALNQEYDKEGSWWNQIVNDERLFIGIRHNYLDVYYQGNRLMSLRHSNGKLIGKTSAKYLIEDKLLAFTNGKIEPEGRERIPLLDDFQKDLDKIRRASMPYAGEEKEGIQRILREHQNIIDVEIALTPNGDGEGSAAKRIDFAAFQQTDKGPELRFFEAKHFSNKEIRAKDPADPPVLEQIKEYEKLIVEYAKKGDILKAYGRVIKNLLDLEGISEKRKTILGQCKGDFEVCNLPWLVIFGFDNAQKRDWQDEDGPSHAHYKKLVDGLTREKEGIDGEDRIKMKGDAKDIRVPFGNGHHPQSSV